MFFEDLLTYYPKPIKSGRKRKCEPEEACYPIKAKVTKLELNLYRDKNSEKITLKNAGTPCDECNLCGIYKDLKSEQFLKPRREIGIYMPPMKIRLEKDIAESVDSLGARHSSTDVKVVNKHHMKIPMIHVALITAKKN